MERAPERTLTDVDEYVSLRMAADGLVVIEVSPNGFRIPPDDLARRIVETAAGLPHPLTEGRDAIETGIEAVTEIHRAMTSGGFEAVTAMMRRRLGIDDPPPASLSRDPEQDATLGAMLGATLDNMRQSVREPEPAAPAEHCEATALTEEEDVGVTTSSEQIIADVRLSPSARRRGVEGLGQILTELLARARTDLAERSGRQLRRNLPQAVVDTMDSAPEESEKAARTSTRMIDEVVRVSDTLRRKAGK